MRFQQEESLTPAETRAFLEIHAEREARGTRPSDLAETLGLSPEETRAILAEARRRTKPRSVSESRIWFAIVGGFTIFFVMLLTIGRFNRRAPALAVVPLGKTIAPSLPPLPQPAAVAIPTPPLAEEAPFPIPNGFELSIQVPGSRVYSSEPMTDRMPDYRTMGKAQLAQVRAELVENTLNLLETASESPGAWMRAPEISISVRLRGRAWTQIKIPITPYTLPLTGNPKGRESLRQTLSALYEAGWSDILRSGPSRSVFP